MASPHVIEVTESNFQKEVVERSLTTPVLLDFWASWCGPCKQLTPVLEKLAAEFGGGFILGKVDTEAQVALSQAFQVQSIPFVVLLVGGRPADAFAGAVGEPELRSFLEKNRVEAQEGGGDAEEEAMVPADEAGLAAARAAALQGDVAATRDALAGFPEESSLVHDHDNLLAGLDFLEAAIGAGEAGELLGRARTLFLSGEFEGALQAIVASAQVDRDFADGLARRAMLLLQAVRPDDAMVDDYRRQLATLLY